MTSQSDRKEKEAFVGRSGATSSPRVHNLCQKRLEFATNRSSYVRYMLDAMKKAGCEVCLPRHLVCEPCGPRVAGGFDPHRQQIVLCENNIYSQGHMNETLTHELIHSYDYCRAHLDWDNLQHLACTEIRAANLSSECFFWKETFARLKFGWKKHHQACVKERASKSMQCVRELSDEEAKAVVESVFHTCFSDTDPFERVPP